MASIGGHTFQETPKGRRCLIFSASKLDVCNCAWIDLRACSEKDVGITPGLAHAGMLTSSEYAEIRAEVMREEDAIWAAVIDAASAGSR